MSGPFNIDERLNKSDKATQATAEAGTDDTQWMSPLKTLQSIQANAVSSSPIIENSVTYTVGSTGDYPTLNAAIEDVSRKYPIYKQAGVRVTLELQAGFVMAEQVLVDGIDLSWVTITGVDSETVIDRQALTSAFGLDTQKAAFCAIKSGRHPVIGQQFSMNTSGVAEEKSGVYVSDAGSFCNILPNCGVKNTYGYGCFASRGATIVASETDFSGSLGSGGAEAAYNAFLEGVIIANNSVANSSNYGYRAILGGKITCYESTGSAFEIFAVTAQRGGKVDATSCNFSGAPFSELQVGGSGGIISARGTTGSLSQTANTITTNGIIFQ